MKRKTRSILYELDRMAIDRDRVHVLENRANNIIASAINLINMIKESYSHEDAEDLEKRLLNSIKTQDPRKFNRAIKRIKEEKKNILD